MREAIRIDVDGTGIAVGVATPEGEIPSDISLPSDKLSEDLIASIARAVGEENSGHDAETVRPALSGLIRSSSVLVREADSGAYVPET